MIQVDRTIISQYGNSPTLLQLCHNIDQYIDPRINIDDFYNFVWNVDTAEGFGLDIWGRIVVIGRELQVADDPVFFGFEEALPGSYPFDEAPFYSGEAAATSTYILADDAYRTLILLKALSNITSCSAPAINQLLQNMFAGRGRVYVSDLGDMAMRINFHFDLTPVERAIITQSGIIPRPAGVKAYVTIIPLPVFGFVEAGDGMTPFDDAPFRNEATSYAVI